MLSVDYHMVVLVAVDVPADTSAARRPVGVWTQGGRVLRGSQVFTVSTLQPFCPCLTVSVQFEKLFDICFVSLDFSTRLLSALLRIASFSSHVVFLAFCRKAPMGST